jgi:prepilin-type N-terminal cleavage/methylation domain-containing protein
MKKLMISSLSKVQKAFTLVELMIAVSVIMISLSIGVANYLRFLDKQRLYQAGSSIEIMLKEARARAQNGYLGNEEIGFCAQLAGAQVTSVVDGNGKVAVIGSLNCADGSSLTYDDYTVEQAEAVLDQHFQILFYPLRGAALTLGGASSSSGAATLTYRDSSVIFNLDQGGTINVSYE